MKMSIPKPGFLLIDQPGPGFHQDGCFYFLCLLFISLFVVLTVIKYMQWTSLLILCEDISVVNALQFG